MDNHCRNIVPAWNDNLFLLLFLDSDIAAFQPVVLLMCIFISIWSYEA